MIQDDSGGNEEERDQNENPKSPTASSSQQETKVSSFTCYLLFPLCMKLNYYYFIWQYSFLGRRKKKNTESRLVNKRDQKKSKLCCNNQSAYSKKHWCRIKQLKLWGWKLQST